MEKVGKEILEKVRRIQVLTTKYAEGILAGPYHSAFKGRGMEFEEVREYFPGDEIRTIDWNVTARMNHPYVKTFREEREMTVMLVIDLSSSTLFGSGGKTKRDVIAEVGGVLAFSAIENDDKVGLILFSDRVEKYIPPKKGSRHVLRVIREILAWKPRSSGTCFDSALTFLGSVMGRRAICFMISDYIADLSQEKLAVLTKKHDMIAIQVEDRYDIELPDLGVARFRDLEGGGEIVIDSSSSKVRKAFEEKARERKERLEKVVNRTGAGFIHVRTDQPWIGPIRKFFKLRKVKH